MNFFFYFFIFFSTVNSMDKWKEISKTFIQDKGLVRDEDFIRGAELFAASRED